MDEHRKDPVPGGEWLSLGEAARLLDVHPTTLRRWANSGQIATMVTPGGHRRFSVSEVSAFIRERSALRNMSGFAGLWATKAMAHTRQEVVTHQQNNWLSQFDERAREHNRELGRQLMGLTLQYLSSDTSDSDQSGILQQARQIGHQYARFAIEQGLTLRATLEASMFFRDSLIEAALHLPDTANIRPEANLRLVKRINTLLNTVHLAVAEVFEEVGK